MSTRQKCVRLLLLSCRREMRQDFKSGCKKEKVTSQRLLTLAKPNWLTHSRLSNHYSSHTKTKSLNHTQIAKSKWERERRRIERVFTENKNDWCLRWKCLNRRTANIWIPSWESARNSIDFLTNHWITGKMWIKSIPCSDIWWGCSRWGHCMLCRTRTSFSVKALNRRKSECKGDEREREREKWGIRYTTIGQKETITG